MLKEFAYDILKLIGELNYWHVAIFAALESTAFPVIIPVETLIIPLGYYAYLGTKSLPLLIIFTTAGIVVGCLINYYFAMFLGRGLIYKHSKLLHISTQKLEKLEKSFLKHGRLLMFVGRFVPVPAFKHLITIPAGMAKMPVRQFMFYNALGGAIFSTAMYLIGYFFGSNQHLIHKALKNFTIVCVALLISYIATRVIFSQIAKRRRAKKESRK